MVTDVYGAIGVMQQSLVRCIQSVCVAADAAIAAALPCCRVVRMSTMIVAAAKAADRSDQSDLSDQSDTVCAQNRRVPYNTM